jgi:hypothetical protein
VLRPTTRSLGLIVVLAFLIALVPLTGTRGLIPLVVALSVPAAFSPLLAWRRARRAAGALHVQALAVPPMVPVGATATLELAMVNTSRWRTPAVGLERPDGWWRRLGDVPWGREAEGDSTGPGTAATPAWFGRRRAPSPVTLVRLAALNGGDSTTTVLAVPTAARGVWALAPRRAWVHDPFGLCGVVVTQVASVIVVVHPRRAPADDVPLTARSGAVTNVVTTPDRRPTTTDVGGEFADLRPYVPGDRLHLLHWPALARHGTLLVRQFDPDAGGVVHIVLDDRIGVHRRGAFEDVLSTILTLVDNAAALGLPVELTTMSGARTTVAPTPAGVAGVLPLLAAMRPRRPSDVLSTSWVPGEGVGRPVTVTTVTGAGRLPASWHDHTLVIAR